MLHPVRMVLETAVGSVEPFSVSKLYTRANLADPRPRALLECPVEQELPESTLARVEVLYGDTWYCVYRGCIAACGDPGPTCSVRIESEHADKWNTAIERSYRMRKSGAILRDVLEQLDVPFSRLEDGPTLFRFDLFFQFNLWRQLQEMAKLASLDLFIDATDRVVFASSEQEDVHRLHPREELLGAQNLMRSAGQGGRLVAQVTRDHADPRLHVAASAGKLRLTGRPDIQLGSYIQAGMGENGHIDKSFEVIGIAHSYGPGVGLVTELHWSTGVKAA